MPISGQEIPVGGSDRPPESNTWIGPPLAAVQQKYKTGKWYYSVQANYTLEKGVRKGTEEVLSDLLPEKASPDPHRPEEKQELHDDFLGDLSTHPVALRAPEWMETPPRKGRPMQPDRPVYPAGGGGRQPN